MHEENERIKELRKALKLSQESFGNAIGLTKSSISNVEKGVRNVTEQHIKLLSTAYNVSELWLRTGEGEMFIESGTFSLDQKAKQHNLSDLEIDIMKGYMELSKDTREDLLNLFSTMFSKHSTNVEKSVDPIDKELASYRVELEQEKKFRTSQVLHEQNAKYKDG